MKYDVIVVGAGAGGGVAAGLLAEAGKSVLLLERGQWLTFEQVGRDHLRNQRLSRYGVNAGPMLAGNPRAAITPQGKRIVVGPLEPGYQNNAACVGGGTLVYGAQAWRFLPEDFQMATRYGIPKGSSLADWPITYDDLAPCYERAEWEMGVSGDEESAGKNRPRHKPYPMPPLPLNTQGRILRAGAAALGWATQPVPLLINSIPYQGRDACVHCQHCVGFACPVNAKNGTQNTWIARAVAAGCTVESEAMAERIQASPSGRVTGVTYWNHLGERVTAESELVVVSAGAIETARLLLNSHSPAHPHGLGNAGDQVGRHLQGHYYASGFGWMNEPIWDGVGPGATTATIRFNHGNEGIIGGGMVADDFIEQPINFVKRSVPGAPRWGLAHKQWVRQNYTRMLRVAGPVHEIPSPDARVTADPDVQDRWGIPAARLSGTTHPETLRSHAFMNARCHEWLRACDAEGIVYGTGLAQLELSAGQHQAGTCRMGHDPKSSVTDLWGRVHGHDNLFIADSSLHVTNGGFNPVLTILALAYRVAGHLLDQW